MPTVVADGAETAVPRRKEPLPMTLLQFLYDKCIQEEQFHLDEQQKRVAFFAGLLSALIGGTVAGMLQAKRPEEFGALILGPTLAFSLARMARAAGDRFYRRFLEAVAQRAKLEVELGLHVARDLGDGWTGQAPLVPRRHLISRKKCKDDLAFVENNRGGGYQRIIRNMFTTAEVVSVLLGLVLLVRLLQSM